MMSDRLHCNSHQGLNSDGWRRKGERWHADSPVSFRSTNVSYVFMPTLQLEHDEKSVWSQCSEAAR